MKNLDSIDMNILKALQKNARITYRELSKKVNLTPPAVTERILKLEELGILIGYHACVDLQALGLGVASYIKMTVPHHKEKDLISFATDRPEVIECQAISGLSTFMLKVALPSLEHLEAFTKELFTYGQTENYIIMSDIISRKEIVPQYDEGL
jgi:Lrp/AsnC family transcriptional regulator, leucine-responsive regulatory protein